MTKRDVVRQVFAGERPAYVPWHCQFTCEAWEALRAHFGGDAGAEAAVDNHFLELGSAIGFFEDVGANRFRDVFGVVWDRSVDRDIGNVEGYALPEPTLAGYAFPDPLDARFFRDIPQRIDRHPERFRVFYLGFSLFERAWTLRGMENLLMDFIDHPDFVHALLSAIADYDIAQVREALKYDIDAVYFGDDWGQQHGLIMGKPFWDEYIKPQLRRLYAAVRASGKYLMIHSCGDVDELFDDLIGLGLNGFNPFQPEVMDTHSLLRRYRGRLAFHGGLSTQRTLPYGSEADVRAECRRLLNEGRCGGYVFAPAHAVEGDVPLANILAFMNEVQSQPAYVRRGHPAL
ncbi:MAG TPA: uroporphyrinogen decarboxylase family protein [Kiritimatiellia bacterium]|nr:uroporphyrinogen decarboxylase family protein [Kiritimatiellia bacterium]HPS09353.1 uroporphyrinogen decarboxylase family protein [Kiritimatiellia bacterium]